MHENVLAWRGSAEVAHTDDLPFVTSPAMPADWRPRLNRDTLLDALGQNAFAISLVLGVEQIPARHADHTCLHSMAFQFLLRLHTELNFGAGTDEDHIRWAIAGFRKDVSASRYARVLRSTAIEMGNILPREHQDRRTVTLNRNRPCFGGLVRIGRANQREAGNPAQAGKVLDGLVSRAILTQSYAVVRKYIDRF